MTKFRTFKFKPGDEVKFLPNCVPDNNSAAYKPCYTTDSVFTVIIGCNWEGPSHPDNCGLTPPTVRVKLKGRTEHTYMYGNRFQLVSLDKTNEELGSLYRNVLTQLREFGAELEKRGFKISHLDARGFTSPFGIPQDSKVKITKVVQEVVNL